MPSVLRQFPAVLRSGVQQTAYAQLPAGILQIQLVGDGDESVRSDPDNMITFEVLVSPTGSDADADVIATEGWQGGTTFDKRLQQNVPSYLDVSFVLPSANQPGRVALRATFSQPMVIGATLTGLP